MQGDNKQPLPPELDWDNMKEGIFDKMQSIEQAEGLQRGNKDSKKRIGLFLLLFYALALGLFFISQKMMKAPDTPANGIVQLSEVDGSKSASTDVNLSESFDSTGIATKPLSKNDPETQAKDLQNTSPTFTTNQDPKKVEDIRAAMVDLPGSESIGKRNPLDKLQRTDPFTVKHSPDSIKNSTFSLVEERNSKVSMLELQALSTSILGPVSLEKMNPSLLDIQRLDSANLTELLPGKSPDQLILEGGMALWSYGYGNARSERAQYELPLASLQLQGHYMKRFKRDYFVMAGLQYQQLDSRFAYNSPIDDYKITLEDTVIQVRNNLLTGEQSIVRGDVEQSVKAERRVRHYNRSRLFKASIGIGRSWRFQAFQTDVYLGGALNGLVQNQGRTLSDDSVIDYEGISNALFQNQFTAEGMLGVRLHYFLNSRMGVTTGLQAQKSLMNWSKEGGIKQYPASLSLQLGLSYSLE